MKVKANQFHVLATFFNVYGTKEQLNAMIEGGAFSKRDAKFTVELLNDLHYSVDWAVEGDDILTEESGGYDTMRLICTSSNVDETIDYLNDAYDEIKVDNIGGNVLVVTDNPDQPQYATPFRFDSNHFDAPSSVDGSVITFYLD